MGYIIGYKNIAYSTGILHKNIKKNIIFRHLRAIRFDFVIMQQILHLKTKVYTFKIGCIDNVGTRNNTKLGKVAQ